MSGDFSKYCNCPRIQGECPHCNSNDFVNFATYSFHIDSCHRRAKGYRPPVNGQPQSLVRESLPISR